MAARDGAAFLAGLRDERSIWLGGERVADVTSHPALQRGARSIAALYDLQLRPDLRDEMTYPSPGSGEPVGLSFLEPRSVDDLVRRRRMFEHWARTSGGMLGRTPDYLNVLMMACAANRDFFERGGAEYGQRVVDYYRYIRERDLCLTHTLVTPQRDRGLAPSDGPEDTSLRVVDETSDAIVVRGARILATLAPFADELLVMPSPSRSYSGERSPQAVAFAIPMDTPGLSFICRESFDLGRPVFDHPLASRFEEMDAVAVFEDVLVPRERFFIYGDVALAGGLFRQTHVYVHCIHQFLAKNLAKAEFVLGVGALIARTIKVDQHLHVQAMLGELVNAVETIRAFIRAAEADAEPDEYGVFVPRPDTLLTARSYFPSVYPRLVEILQLVGSSGLMAIPDQATVDSEIADSVELYLQSATLGGRERVKLFRLAWDVACSAFGSRQVLYERYFAGDPFRNLAGRYVNYDTSGATALVEALLDQGEP